MRYTGVADRRAVTDAELDTYVRLLHRGDGGRAFLRIMKGFELDAGKSALYAQVLRSPRYPVQIVWSEGDRALSLARHGRLARELAPDAPFYTVPGRHFPQEDQAEAVAGHVATLARAADATASTSP
jgi:pimeloyl-ACP methyl ester carboxylesterase